MFFLNFISASILKIVFFFFGPQYIDASIFEYSPQIFQLLYMFLKLWYWIWLFDHVYKTKCVLYLCTDFNNQLKIWEFF